MIRINPELIAPPSHTYKGQPVQVFWSTKHNGEVAVNLTIDSKWTQVLISDLVPIEGVK